MLGLNTTVTILRTTRAVTPSGGVDEVESTLLTGVPAAIQAHLITNLPPPQQRSTLAGEVYKQEYRCWVPMSAASDIQDDDYIVDESTAQKYQVIAAIDEAGRGHHWLLRLRKYS